MNALIRACAACIALSTCGSLYGEEVLRLSFLGDIMAHKANFRMKDYADIYRDLADLLTADDLTFANLELPIDPLKPLGDFPLFNGSRAYWEAAVSSGVEVFSLANNHAFDQGVQGIFQTIRSSQIIPRETGRGIWVSGTRGNPEVPFAPVWIDVKGFRIGFIAATQFLNRGGSPYINLVDYHNTTAADAFLSQVASWSRQADIFIVSYHCGVEYSSAPGADLVAFFRRLLKSGATVVWGHHPHVFQRWRVERTSDSVCFILPSMGNFISGMTWGMSPATPLDPIAATGDSAIVRIDFVRGAGRVRPLHWDAVPTSNYVDAASEMVVGRLRDLAEGKPFLSTQWTSYYAARLKALRGILDPLIE